MAGKPWKSLLSVQDDALRAFVCRHIASQLLHILEESHRFHFKPSILCHIQKLLYPPRGLLECWRVGHQVSLKYELQLQIQIVNTIS